VDESPVNCPVAKLTPDAEVEVASVGAVAVASVAAEESTLSVVLGGEMMVDKPTNSPLLELDTAELTTAGDDEPVLEA